MLLTLLRPLLLRAVRVGIEEWSRMRPAIRSKLLGHAENTCASITMPESFSSNRKDYCYYEMAFRRSIPTLRSPLKKIEMRSPLDQRDGGVVNIHGSTKEHQKVCQRRRDLRWWMEEVHKNIMCNRLTDWMKRRPGILFRSQCT